MPSNSSVGLSTRAQDTRTAQFVLLCANLPWIIGGTFLVACALFFFVKDQVPLNQRLLWLFVVLLVIALRSWLLRRWYKHPSTEQNVNQRIALATLLTSLMGCLFGLIAFLTICEDDPLSSVLMVMLLTGMVASATASVSHLLPMYLLYILPIMLPTAYRLSEFEEAGYHWIAGLILVYLIVNIGTSRSIRASILRSINVRFENLELLEDLRREKKRAEDALKSEELANHAKSKFIAAASHDLRQPMHSLRLFTATLELQTRDTGHKTLVSKIDSSVKSLEDLFHALLDISKLDAGTFSVDKQHVYLDNLLSQIEGEFKALADAKNLQFGVELQDHVVYTDAMHLERLLRNLVSNAIRYTEQGEVSVTTRVENGQVLVSVSDTGLGISPEDQAKIFEEFVQLGNVGRNRSQGIGLGLSIVKRLSDLLDVRVHLDSTLSQGSVFSLNLPLGDVTQCRFKPTQILTLSPLDDALFVLVIDDEEDVCLAIEGLLETWGCIVMTAGCGNAAVTQLEEIGEVPDVIISDYRLRDGETGGDAITRVHEYLNKKTPAIILTGDIAPERLKAMGSLGYPMLHKPCEPNVLRKLIASVCSKSDQ